MLFEDNTDTNPRILNPFELEEYLQCGEIDITENEIQDKSNGDILSKGLVILQTTWFLLQCIARRVEHLPITELELVTLALAALNFMTYVFWWNKPLSVQCPYRVLKTRKPMSKVDGKAQDKGEGQDVREEDSGQVRRRGIWRTIGHGAVVTYKLLLEPFGDMAGGNDEIRATRVSTFYAGDSEVVDMMQPMFAASCTAALFGSIHCFGWMFAFPSRTEQLLWRISCITITSVPVLLGGVIISWEGWLEKWVKNWWAKVENQVPKPLKMMWDAGLWLAFTIFVMIPAAILIFASPVLYILARVTLLILSLASLRSLPAEAFQTVQWTTFIPHV